MSGVNIEVLRDPDATKQGCAIIRLAGLFEIPNVATFRIEPIDETDAARSGQGWPSGDLTPRAVRLGDKGVELSIGPDLIDSPGLLPGTPVVFSLPSADLRGELRWPSLPVTRGERRGAVVVSGERRAADIAARAEAQRSELARITATRIEVERQDRDAALAMLAAKRIQAETAVRTAGSSAITVAASGAVPSSSAVDVDKGGSAARTSLSLVPPPIPAQDDASSAERAADGPRSAAATDAAGAAQELMGLSAAAKAPTAGDDAGSLKPRYGSAGQVLARQVSTREAPTRASARTLLASFGVGFLAAVGLAYVSTLFLSSDETASRRQAEQSARQLMIEADDMRQRLAAETQARRAAEDTAARRIAELESERQKLVAAAIEARQEAEMAAQRRAGAASQDSEAKRQLDAVTREVERWKGEVGAATEARKRAEADRAAEAKQRAAAEREAANLRKLLADAAAPKVAEVPSVSSVSSAPPSTAVTLRVKDSDFEVSGELKSYDGKRYVIVTKDAGSMLFDAERVTCGGAGCPAPIPAAR